MQRTYRVPLARKGLVGLLALLVLLAYPGTSIAGGASESTKPSGQAGTALLQRGSGYGTDQAKAARVRTVQRTLRRVGWQPGPVDGLFGPRTEAAVVRFQHNANLAVDGIVGPRTTSALERARTGALKRGAGYAQPDGSPRVRTLQTRLRRLGLRAGPVDGLFGPRTEAAVIRFQHKGGLPATGVATRRTGRLLAAANAPVGTGSQPTKAKPAPQRKTRPVAASPSGSGNGSDVVDVALLIAVGLLALLVGAVGAILLTRLRRGDDDMAIPLGRSLDAEGWSKSRGAFRGRVHALVLRGGRVLRKGETRYLVNDPRKDAPFWVTHEEVRRLVEPPPPPGATSPPVPVPVPEPEPSEPAMEEDVRALGYVGFRDSGELEGVRLQEQADDIAAVCDDHGWQLLEVVRDVQESGDRGLERPGLRYALERIRRGEASCLVVSELGGLARSAAELSRLLDALRAVDGRLVARDVELDTSSPEARVAINALTAVGGWEGEPIPEEPETSQAGSRVAALRASQPRASRLAVDAPAIKARIVSMRNRGMTFQAIADQLNDEGVPTLGGGLKWRPSSVRYAATTAPGTRPAPLEGGSS
jgi:peptidoglycan hydrolase-like protein with peptidoglycan-binding domain/DNA invertase Pin-like site-specific DNA recombinase